MKSDIHIGAVEQTRKITNAMNLISSARMKKVYDAYLSIHHRLSDASQGNHEGYSSHPQKT
jgi:F0F1-type ATP synthase gamma subunit